MTSRWQTRTRAEFRTAPIPMLNDARGQIVERPCLSPGAKPFLCLTDASRLCSIHSFYRQPYHGLVVSQGTLYRVCCARSSVPTGTNFHRMPSRGLVVELDLLDEDSRRLRSISPLLQHPVEGRNLPHKLDVLTSKVERSAVVSARRVRIGYATILCYGA